MGETAPGGAMGPGAQQAPVTGRDVPAVQRDRYPAPGTELLHRRAQALGQLRAGDFGKLMISSVSPAHPGRVDTPSSGPFTETFFLPALR